MIGLFFDTALIVFGLFFLFTGVSSFKNPEKFARSLSLDAIGHSGRVEIRAQYGGFFVAAALSQFAYFANLNSKPTAFLVALIIFGGLIFGRAAAALFNPEREKLAPMIRNLIWIDAAGAIVSLSGLMIAK